MTRYFWPLITDTKLSRGLLSCSWRLAYTSATDASNGSPAGLPSGPLIDSDSLPPFMSIEYMSDLVLLASIGKVFENWLSTRKYFPKKLSGVLPPSGEASLMSTTDKRFSTTAGGPQS